jgi:hypothetical protein
MSYFKAEMIENLKKCIQRLYDKDKRLGLYPTNFWIIDKKLTNLDNYNLDQLCKNINKTLLENAPQTIPFEIRARVFRLYLENEKETRQGQMFSLFHSEGFEIRRDYMLEDAFEKLFGMGEDIKNRFRIQFVDSNYITEEGVDGGGLFKEFMTKLT